MDRELAKLIREGFDIETEYFESKMTPYEVKMMAKKAKQINTLKGYIEKTKKEYQKRRYDSAIKILERGLKNSERFNFPKWHERFTRIIENIQQKHFNNT